MKKNIVFRLPEKALPLIKYNFKLFSPFLQESSERELEKLKQLELSLEKQQCAAQAAINEHQEKLDNIKSNLTEAFIDANFSDKEIRYIFFLLLLIIVHIYTEHLVAY